MPDLHRYWRLLITHRTVGTGYVGASEVQFRATEGGADQCSGGTASASSEYNPSTHGADKAFDDNDSTNWASGAIGATFQQWLKYDFGEGNDVEVHEVTIRSRSDASDGPTDFSLQFSDDDSDWTDYAYFFNQPDFAGSGETQTYNRSSDVTIFRDQFAPKDMTSFVDPAPYVISSSTFYNASYYAWKTFNRVYNGIGGYWITSSGNDTGWIKVDLGAGNADEAFVVGVRVNGIPEPNRAPKDFTIQGSNNDSDWDTLSTETEETDWGDAECRLYTLSAPGSYRYYKIDVTDNNGDALLSIAEIYLFGTEFVQDISIDVNDAVSVAEDITLQQLWITDFSAQTLWDASPTDWTERWHTSNIEEFIARSPLRPDSSRQALKLEMSGNRGALSWDVPSSVTDAEILARVWLPNAYNNAGIRLYLRGSGTTGETAYFVSIDSELGEFALGEYNNGSYTDWDSTPFTPDPGVWYWMRFQAIGTALKGKVWADGDAEPGAWQVEASDASLATGWVGVGGYYQSDSPYYDWIGVSLGGSTVPEPTIADAAPAAVFTDFSEYSGGDPLVEWTDMWHGCADKTTANDGDFGGVVGRIVAAGGARMLCAWDLVAGVDDVEVLARIRCDETGAGNIIWLAIRTAGDGADENAYVMMVDFSGDNLLFGKYVSAGWTQLDSDSFVSAPNTWYWMRVRAEGTAIKGKIWAGDVADEPGAWQFEETDAALDSGGVAWGGGYSSAYGDCDYYAVALDGDTAPAPTLSISVNDSVSIAEDITVSVSAPVGPSGINVNDTVSVAESVTALVSDNIIDVNDSVSITEDVTVSIPVLSINVTDTVSLTEDIDIDATSLPTLNIAVNDTVSIAEQVITTVSACNIDVNDSVSAAEVLGIYLLLSPTVVDTVSVVDIVTFFEEQSSVNISMTETISVTENHAEILPVKISVVDTISIAESYSTIGILKPSIFDASGVSESVSIEVSGLNISVNESISVSDLLTDIGMESGFYVSVYESITLVENLGSGVSDCNINILDAIGVSEWEKEEVDFCISMIQTVRATESLSSKGSDLKVGIYDTITITESVSSIHELLFIGTVDSISTSEVVTVLTPSPNINTSDVVAIAEVVVVNILESAAREINVYDTVTISESLISVISGLSIFKSEDILVSETVNMYWTLAAGTASLLFDSLIPNMEFEMRKPDVEFSTIQPTVEFELLN